MLVYGRHGSLLTRPRFRCLAMAMMNSCADISARISIGCLSQAADSFRSVPLYVMTISIFESSVKLTAVFEVYEERTSSRLD